MKMILHELTECNDLYASCIPINNNYYQRPIHNMYIMPLYVDLSSCTSEHGNPLCYAFAFDFGFVTVRPICPIPFRSCPPHMAAEKGDGNMSILRTLPPSVKLSFPLQPRHICSIGRLTRIVRTFHSERTSFMGLSLKLENHRFVLPICTYQTNG